MTITLLLLAFGLALLIKGADLLINGAVMTAKKFRISPMIIGLTIVAFGTSMPELVVTIISSLDPETADIGLGNIVGSNISNIGLILGASALLLPLAIQKSTLTREIPLMVISAFVFLALVSDRYFGGAANQITRGDGIILLLFFVIFLYYMAESVFAQRKGALTEEFAKEFHAQYGISLWKALGLIALGLIGVLWGGQLVVSTAVSLARMLGLSEILIGLTIIAVGTSLPEFATSIVSALKKEPDIAVGNIVGSNIFNTFLILGVNAVISPLPFETAWYLDAAVMILFSVMIYVMAKTGRLQIKRGEGIVLLALYLTYIGYIIARG